MAFSADDIDDMDFALPMPPPRLAGGSRSGAGVGMGALAQALPPPTSGRGRPPLVDPAQARHQLTWPQGMASTAQEACRRSRDWVRLYPVYLDAARSTAAGRRVPAAIAVDRPSIVYMAEAVRQLGLPAVVEGGARHPSDQLTYGRLRVQLRARTGPEPAATVPLRADVPSKTALLQAVARLYPQMRDAQEAAADQNAAVADALRSTLDPLLVEQLAQSAKAAAGKNDASSPAAAAIKDKKKARGRKGRR
ncbi:hypothetical protein CXG81DRAFT_23766 [Caulochytrium protostelioides]|uniref:Signal recognition particle, SRP19 subunit n=1 Tax=Caulochytrium protostelioides TaxID=1555241 RepID=A0A4P9XDS6_9FUNG|nr:hypothetical protein CXG81DRAFT_23766 [Caulochytrium protostelioides]|eukprot:RKP03655.1 hypothetical protein CXG81DRAFT_23766 [Caulochytrium protostelioides]